MSGNTIGTLFRLTTFGESHGPAIGAVLDGTPSGTKIDREFIQSELDRRKPGQSQITTSRNESDSVEILAGVLNGTALGTPIHLLIRNKDAQSGAYDNLRELYRPGHADFTYWKKYGIRDHRGGGRSSGRETSARVAGGAIAKTILQKAGISITAYVKAVAGVWCKTKDLSVIEQNNMRACDMEAAAVMEQRVLELAAAGNSAGGIVECLIEGLSPGLGEPVFSKLDAELAKAILSIGAVKGIEFGGGFACADSLGSEWNDQMDEKGFLTNNAGGILGGISTGEEIIFRAAVKPTPSIEQTQSTRDIHGKKRNIVIEGRHDPTICPRIVPVMEAMAALVITDMVLMQQARNGSVGDYD